MRLLRAIKILIRDLWETSLIMVAVVACLAVGTAVILGVIYLAGLATSPWKNVDFFMVNGAPDTFTRGFSVLFVGGVVLGLVYFLWLLAKTTCKVLGEAWKQAK
jgi:hypothetical protein